MGYDVVAIEADPGISGRTWKRPAVQRTMQSLDDGQTDIIILWKWSRLSRSRKDWALAIDRADLAGGRIESATEPIDTATASGRFARGVMTEYAAFQSEQIGETWEEVRQRRLSRGLPAAGRLPYGWTWVEGGIASNPEQAPIVVEMYRRYLGGDGSAVIAQWLNAQHIPGPNGNAWTRARPLTVMDSPIHAGLIPYRGATYPGAHEPIIGDGTWTAYQDERRHRRDVGARPRNYDHLLSMLMRCECGARMHGKGSMTGGKWYGGYICGDTLNDHPTRAYVSAKTIDPVITDWLMTFDPDLDVAPSRALDDARRQRLISEVAELEDEMDELTRQLKRKIVGEARYQRVSAAAEAELALKYDEIRRLRNNDRSAPTAGELVEFRESWEEFTVAEKNKLLRKLLAGIDLLEGSNRARLTTTWGSSSVVNL